MQTRIYNVLAGVLFALVLIVAGCGGGSSSANSVAGSVSASRLVRPGVGPS